MELVFGTLMAIAAIMYVALIAYGFGFGEDEDDGPSAFERARSSK